MARAGAVRAGGPRDDWVSDPTWQTLGKCRRHKKTLFGARKELKRCCKLKFLLLWRVYVPLWRRAAGLFSHGRLAARQSGFAAVVDCISLKQVEREEWNLWKIVGVASHWVGELNRVVQKQLNQDLEGWLTQQAERVQAATE